LLRRVAQLPNGIQEIFQVDDLKIDLTKRQVFVAEKEIHLTPIEFNLLSILVNHAGFVVTHRQLLEKIWGASYIEHSHYLRIYMRQLRQKLECDSARPRYLLTEAGIGYRLYAGKN
jgi:two-component system KDP operon response regulator KdpE